MAVDFTAYMNKPLGEMKRVTLPEGHYFGTIKGVPEPKESAKNKPMLVVKIKVDSAGEDVDDASLPEEGCAGKVITVNHMLDQDFGRDSIRKLIEATGIPTDPTQPWGQYVPQLDGQPIKFFNKPRKMDADDEDSWTEDVKQYLSPTA